MTRLHPTGGPAGMPGAGTLIAVEDVTVVYGTGAAELKALRGVSLDVRAGEILFLMGPSGSGKTTLLQVLGCLLRPTTGRIRLHGRALDGLNPEHLGQLRLRNFGFVFQGFNLFPTLRAWENVAVALDLHGIRGREAEAHSRALLDKVGLAHRANAFPSQMSGGQKQRVAIARALAGDPDIILADEPTAALDAANAMRIAELLRRLADRRDRAVVIVTHDRRLVTAGDRVVTVEDGLLATGTEPLKPCSRRVEAAS